MKFQDYFGNIENYFWTWDFEEATSANDDMVITIAEGNTIVYLPQLLEALQSFESIPPLGTLLLLFIATNADAPTALAQVRHQLLPQLDTFPQDPALLDYRNMLEESLAFLALISQLPATIKQGENRLLLLSSLIRQMHLRYRRDKILPLIKPKAPSPDKFIAFEQHFNDILPPRPLTPAIFKKDFTNIRLLARAIKTTQDLEEVLKNAGILNEPLVLAPALNTQPLAKEQHFVDELIAHQHTFPIGCLISYIWSGLNVPFHPSIPSQQALGGVSDLSNKGHFDQLLLSEFAYSETLFLVRIANNESLYYQREAPPQTEQMSRILLLDISIKNWGIPKILAHAVAIAISKHPKSNLLCQAFAIGEHYETLQYDSLVETIQSTGYLSGNLDAHKGLEAYFKENPPKKNQEIFFISSQEATQKPDMQRALAQYQAAIQYWVFTDATGKIDLYRHQNKSRRHLQKLVLPLENIWSKKRNMPMQTPSSNATHLLPLLLYPTKSKYTLTTDNKVFHIFKNFLLESFPDKRGWLIQYTNVPVASAYALGNTSHGHLQLLCYKGDEKQLNIIDIQQNTQASHNFDWRFGKKKMFVFHQKAFFIQMNSGVSTTFQLVDGQIKEEKAESPPPIVEQFSASYTSPVIKTQASKKNVIINVKRLYINRNKHLCINNNAYKLLHKNLLLSPDNNMDSWIAAQPHSTEPNVFYFTNGYQIVVHPLGIIMLGKPNQTGNFSYIYLPTIVQYHLGASTDTIFAGNPFFKHPVHSQTQDIVIFWETYIKPFIEDIIQYETQFNTPQP